MNRAEKPAPLKLRGFSSGECAKTWWTPVSPGPSCGEPGARHFYAMRDTGTLDIRAKRRPRDRRPRVRRSPSSYGIQAVLPHFRERKRGHLIAVSSMLGRSPMTPIRSAYSAAKAAVNSLMVSLRLEIRPDFPDIHASTVFPGVVATDFGTNALHGGPDSRALPMAQPVEEVANIIADLIERPRAEVYTRPEMRDLVGRYFSAEDVGALEAGPPFVMPRR